MEGFVKAKYKATVVVKDTVDPIIIYSNALFKVNNRDGFLVVSTHALTTLSGKDVFTEHAWPIERVLSYSLELNP